MIQKIIGILSFFIALISFNSAYAALTDFTVTGYSYIDSTSSAPTIIIYGGQTSTVSGALTNCTAADSYTTCDTCYGGVNYPCNYTSIYPNLILKFYFKSDNAELVKKGPTIYLKNGSTTINASNKGTNSDGSYYFEITWSSLCSQVTSGNTNCETDISGDFSIGLSTDSGSTLTDSVNLKIATRYVNPSVQSTYTKCTAASITSTYQGACGMTLFPGDEKVYVDEIIFDNLFPDTASSSTIDFNRVLFFFEEGSSAASVTNASKAAEFNITKTNDQYELSDNKIDGLQNGVQYCFRMATEDMAGNISSFTADADSQCVTPEEVVGLLDDKKCFIATAAFGTSLDEHVQLFRKFRDQVLLTNSLGKGFVRAYYKYGPIAANWIADSEVSKFAVRTLLWPMWLLVYFYFEFGIFVTLLLASAMIALIYFSLRFRKKIFFSFLLIFLINPRANSREFTASQTIPVNGQVTQEYLLAQNTGLQNTEVKDGPPREPPFTDVIETEDPESSKLADKLEAQDAKNSLAQKQSENTDQDALAENPNEILKNNNSKHEMIKHPWAEKGLSKIYSDGTYYFKPKKTEKHTQTFSFKLGVVQPPDIISADQTTTFSSMYKGAGLTQANFEYEWYPFTKYGKLGLLGAVGFFYAQGNGRFKSNNQEAREEYTFIALPLSVGLTYRLEWLSRQWVAPYIGGGVSYYGLFEHRDDNKTNNFVGTPASYGVAGAMLNITAFDPASAFEIDSEYGIKNMWLNVEYKVVQSFSEDLNLSTNNIYFGFAVDY